VTAQVGRKDQKAMPIHLPFEHSSGAQQSLLLVHGPQVPPTHA
jgi:hypothetical protein